MSNQKTLSIKLHFELEPNNRPNCRITKSGEVPLDHGKENSSVGGVHFICPAIKLN